MRRPRAPAARRHILRLAAHVAVREAILRAHMRGKPSRPTSTSRSSPAIWAGLSGADLANICNEAAIFAAPERHDVDRRTGTSTPRSSARRLHVVARALNDYELRAVAFHEAGHAPCAELLEGGRPRAPDLDRRPAAARSATRQPPRRPLPQDARRAARRDGHAARRRAARGDRFGASTTGASGDLSASPTSRGDGGRERDGDVDHGSSCCRGRRCVRPNARQRRDSEQEHPPRGDARRDPATDYDHVTA